MICQLTFVMFLHYLTLHKKQKKLCHLPFSSYFSGSKKNWFDWSKVALERAGCVARSQ